MSPIVGYRTLCRTAFRSIFKSKSRAVLTSLGIIIGVTSVIMLMAIGYGLQSYVTGQFESMGSNVLMVMAGQLFDESGRLQQDDRSFYASNNAVFKEKHLKELKKIQGVKSAAGAVLVTTEISFGKEKQKVTAIAGSPEIADIRNLRPDEGFGQFYDAGQNAKKEKVVVLGYQTAQDLFGSLNPLGKKIKIASKQFAVIGVVKKLGGGSGFGPSLDEQIYLPLEFGFDFAGNRNLTAIYLQSPDSQTVASIKKQAEDLLLRDFEKDTFSVFDQSQLLDSINSILGALTAGLSGIAAISLVVGGIGIMNIMLVTVTERTREIGLRKALGATPSLILTQFLLESVILSLLGGAIGIGLGILGTQAIKPFFPASVSPGSVVLSFSVAAFVGIVFGAAPARRASRLNPIDALRYE